MLTLQMNLLDLSTIYPLLRANHFFYLNCSLYFLSYRANALRQDKIKNDYLLKSIDGSVSSIGRAMGTSDYDLNDDAEDPNGGVQTSPTAVILNYFLKSHGGAHLLQSVSSVLATACSIGTIYLTSKYSGTNKNVNNILTLMLLRRTLIFAMIKHVSGLLASASMAAKAIPKIGISQSRVWMEDIVCQPIAQYVFYTVLLLFWLPNKSTEDMGGISSIWWWSRQRWIVPFFIGPILLREMVSNVMLLSDILVLWAFGCSEMLSNAIERLLTISNTVVNVVMSLLVSPNRWRSADPSERHAMLAELISRISLFLEAVVGVIMILDLCIFFFQLIIGRKTGSQLIWRELLTKVVTVRLFLHYLVYLRRKKISELAEDIRGGAIQLPLRVVDSLYEPAKALGITSANELSSDDGKIAVSLRECLSILFE